MSDRTHGPEAPPVRLRNRGALCIPLIKNQLEARGNGARRTPGARGRALYSLNKEPIRSAGERRAPAPGAQRSMEHISGDRWVL